MSYSQLIVEAVRRTDIPAWVEDKTVTSIWAKNLAAAFNGVDLIREIADCASWWISNPVKVKNRKGCSRTIRAWCRRAWEQHRKTNQPMTGDVNSRVDEWKRAAGGN